jgi:Cu/Ag efflux protein CusF
MLACACSAAASAADNAASRDAAAAPDPAHAGAEVPPARHREVLPAGAGGYLEATDAPRLPWPALFRSDGSFAPEPGAGAGAAPPPAAAPVHAGHAGHAMPVMAPSSSVPARGRDARGVVRAVDAARGRITLQHGPIARLDMPGMTMVFRVKDPALLDRLAPGDAVAFDVTIDGSTLYVTGIDR